MNRKIKRNEEIKNRRDEVIVGDKIDVAFNISLNDFQGRKTIQFLMVDFKKGTN